MSITERFASGVRALSVADFAVFVGFGLLANALVVIGLPKVGGLLAAMVLATYIAALSEADAE